MRSGIWAAAALALVLALPGCAVGSSSPVGTPAPQADADLDGLWTLEKATISGTEVPFDGDNPQMVFTDGNAHIFGCFDVDQAMPDGLEIVTASASTTPLASCAAMGESVESAFESMNHVTGGTRDGDNLTLVGENTTLEFSLVAPPASEDIVGEWTLTSVMHGDNGTGFDDKSLTLALTADGEISGTTGCGSFSGTYESSSGLVVVDDLEYSSGLCVSLSGSGEFEQDFHDVLDRGFVMSVSDSGLILRSAQVTATLHYSRVV